jgi:hypothetical protein
MVKKRYAQKALKYKLGPSSEDVWKSREERLPVGEAFSLPVPEWSGSDDEWNVKERMRREGRVDGTT